MSVVCIVCMNRILKYSISKMSVHVFPSCPKKRQIWLNMCKLTNEEVLPNRKICSFHFEPRCFKTTAKRRVLYRDAVPTIFGNGHVKTTNLPLKIAKGRPKNSTKNGIVVQNSKSRILLAKAAKKVVAVQNRESLDEQLERVNSVLYEINELGDFLAEQEEAKSLLLEFLRRKQIRLFNQIKI